MDITTIEALLDVNNELGDLSQRVYVVRDDKGVLYVGRVISGNLHKRFEMHLHISGPNQDPSPLGIEITTNAPSSYEWSVTLFTIDDCNRLLKMNGKRRFVLDIKAAEIALIDHYKPRLNIQSNRPGKPAL